MFQLTKRRVLPLLAVAIVLMSASAVRFQLPAAADSSGFIWRRDALPPLASSLTYVVQGTREKDGSCTYPVRDHAPATGGAWVLRQLALDPQNCRAITEEGVPGDDFRSANGDRIEVAPTANAMGRLASLSPVSGGGLFAGPLMTTYSNSGYTQYWYNDGWGNLQTKVETDINWTFDGSCVLGINVSGSYSWNSGGFNAPIDTSASANVDNGNPCTPGNSVGNGLEYATFPNTNGLCYQYYQPASAQGNQGGGINYGLYSVNSNCDPWISYFNEFKYAPVVG